MHEPQRLAEVSSKCASECTVYRHFSRHCDQIPARNVKEGKTHLGSEFPGLSLLSLSPVLRLTDKQ